MTDYRGKILETIKNNEAKEGKVFGRTEEKRYANIQNSRNFLDKYATAVMEAIVNEVETFTNEHAELITERKFELYLFDCETFLEYLDRSFYAILEDYISDVYGIYVTFKKNEDGDPYLEVDLDK